MDDGTPFVRPGQLHAYQSRIWNCNARFQVWRKGRRIGGSNAFLGRSVWRAIQPRAPNIFWFSHTERGGILSMEDLENWADVFEEAEQLQGRSIWWGGNKKTALTKTSAHFSSGSRFEVMPGSPRNVRGPPGPTEYVFDEHAFHIDPQGMIDAAGPILAMASSRLTVLSTVFWEDVFWELCEKTKREMLAGERGKHFEQITFDDALADGFYEREVAKLVASGSDFDREEWAIDDADLAAYLGVAHRPGARMDFRGRTFGYVSEPDREFLCVPSGATSLYIPKPWVRQCQDSDCKVFRFPAPKLFHTESDSTRHQAIDDFMNGAGRALEEHKRNPPRAWYYGVDFGSVRDLSVMSFGYVDDGVLRTVFVLELEDISTHDQERFFDACIERIGDRGIRRGALDKGGNGLALYQHASRRLGQSRAEGIQFSNEWYSTHWSNLRDRFHDRKIRIPDDKLIESDIGQVKLVNGVPKVPRGARVRMSPAMEGSRGGFRHGDAAISFVLMDYAARDAVVPANAGPGRSSRVPVHNKRAAMRP